MLSRNRRTVHPVPSSDEAEVATDDLRRTWRALIAGAHARRRAGGRTLGPLALPYYMGEGLDEPLLVDVDEDATVVFPPTEVEQFKRATHRWAGSESSMGRVDGDDLLRVALEAAAAAISGNGRTDAALDAVLSTRWAAVVAVPMGGAFLIGGPQRLGRRAVLGHVDRHTERLVADLALGWYPPLEGFNFNYKAEWSEQFLAAEHDSDIADEIDERLSDENGWTPLVLALALDTVGARAEVEAVAAAQALAGAMHLLARKTFADSLGGVLMPWVLDLDGPSEAYFPNDEAAAVPTALRVDTCSRPRGSPDTTTWLGRHQPVDVEQLIEHGYGEALTAVVAGALNRGSPLDQRARVARACQLLKPATSRPLTALGVVAAMTAASIVSPDWEDSHVTALTRGNVVDSAAEVDNALNAISAALVALV